MKDITIVDEIRRQRQRKGISQEAMAFDLSISQAAYSKIERGETELTISRIYEIADILEISVFDLLPKSKYGTGINTFGIRNIVKRLGTFFRFGKRKPPKDGTD
ncbi:helix-turn-helix transcriptional regulator [Daejeonella sp.]|uniref:helix-turn-helix domain-containing protein n=1 Tax=Daejeonella sp. TaxID=2805397 RepID=UPI0030C426B8